jgi:hypothetical protein
VSQVRWGAIHLRLLHLCHDWHTLLYLDIVVLEHEGHAIVGGGGGMTWGDRSHQEDVGKMQRS